MDHVTLSKLLLPMTDAEASVVVALVWLARDKALPASIQEYFFAEVERAVATFLPANECALLRGCRDAKRYRAALDAHFARRRVAANQKEPRNGN